MTKEKQDNSEILEEVGDVQGVDLAQDEQQEDNLKNEALNESQPVDETEMLRNELAATKDKMLRIAADSENFKKRIEREKEALLKYAGEKILRELLNTLDNLDRALELGVGSTEDSQKNLDSLLEGVELTRKGLLTTLEKFDVSPLDCTGQPFDPNQHEAMTVEHSDDIPENHVLQVFVKGYQFKDRLLRASKVIVSKGPAQ